MGNQKGEIVTIAIVATFIILSIATIAASVITQNPKQSFISSSRAADSCEKGKPKGHYCETQANGFGTPPYCVRVDWGQNCEDVYVRDDSIQGCCTQPTAPAGGRACDSKNPSATFCGVDACNGTVTLPNGKKGDPLHCSACNGGWCKGGYCATCGNQPAPTAPPSQNQPTSPPTGGGGGQCSGTVYAPPSGGQQPSCDQFKGRVKIEDNYWNTNCGHICTGDGECSVNGAPGWCYGFGDGKKCMSLGGSWKGCQVQQVSPLSGGQPIPTTGTGGNPQPTRGGGGGNNQPTNPPQPTNTTQTCKLRIYFRDSQSNANLKNVEFMVDPEKGASGGGTGSLTDYYSTGQTYESGDVKITGKKSGYSDIKVTRTLAAPGNNGICEETVQMTKPTRTFTCPSGETTDSTCGGSTVCPTSQNTCKVSTEDPLSQTACYRCMPRICSAPGTLDSACDGKCSPDKCHAVTGKGRNGATCYTCGVAPFNTTVPTNPATPTPSPTSIPASPIPTGIPGKLDEKCIAKTIPQSSGQQEYSCNQGFCMKTENPPMCRAFDKLTYFRNGADPSNPDENPPTIVVVKICFYKKGFISGPCEEYGNENTKLIPWDTSVNTTGLNNLCKKYYPKDENVEIGVDIAFHADNPYAYTKTKSFSALCKNYYQAEVFGLKW